jgi:acyl-CoA thioester hydrolase
MTAFPEPPGGTFDGPVHRFPLRVYFEDTDLSGVVYHANYLRWFERARSEMMRCLGVEQHGIHEGGGGAYAVSELTIRYLAPARLDDAVVIESHVEELRAASCRLRQKALRRDASSGEVVLSEMHLRIGFVGPDGRPRRQPDAWRQAFAAIAPNESPE